MIIGGLLFVAAATFAGRREHGVGDGLTRPFLWNLTMRLSWFTGSHGGRPRKGRRQKNLKASPLLVRQLERRRVLDAALASVATSVVAEINPAPMTVSP